MLSYIVMMCGYSVRMSGNNLITKSSLLDEPNQAPPLDERTRSVAVRYATIIIRVMQFVGSGD
jgi:hypothetical protein